MQMVRKVVISGASRGIGAALAEAMASPGIALLLLARNEENLHRVAERCRASGAQVYVRALDVRNREDVSECLATFAQGGGLQLLIANAGTVFLEPTPTDRGPDWERLQDQIHSNLSSTISLLEAGLSLPVEHRLHLHCVVVSSLNAFLALGEAPGYCMAKAAQHSLVDALEDFYASRPAPETEIVFSQVFPGFVATGMAEGYPGPRPFQCTAQEAAHRILRGVRARRRIIIFPRRLALLIWIGRWLPKALLRWVMAPGRAYRSSWP
jgi:short-subunit dehydrogenase